MQVGALGSIAFEASADTIRTISQLSWSSGARYGEHTRHLGQDLVEFVGIEPAEITIEILLSAALGVTPADELDKILEYERSGKALPLILGGKTVGSYRWVIQSHRAKIDHFSGGGAPMSATVSVKLLEYTRE